MLVSYLIIRNFHYVIYAYPALDLTFNIVNILLMALAALCLTRLRFVQNLFLMASTYVVITVINVLAAVSQLTVGVPEINARILLYIGFSLLIYRARKPFTGIFLQTKKGWWLLCSVPLILIGNFLLISAVPVTLSQNPAAIPAALILCGTTVIIYITFFFMMWEMYKQNQAEQDVMALRLSVSALEHQNELIRRSEQQYALLRHDLRHFTGMMSGCLDNGDANGMRELLAGLNQSANSILTMHTFFGHTLLDVIINHYMELSREAGIEMTVSAEPLDNVAVDKTELAVVFANALENALKACLEMPLEAHQAIRFDGRRQGAQYFLEIVNTYAAAVEIDTETGLPVGRTHGGEKRGLGCKSIDYFARQNGAVLQFQADADGWFHMRMLV
jgi:signal transduction histidine kinase